MTWEAKEEEEELRKSHTGYWTYRMAMNSSNPIILCDRYNASIHFTIRYAESTVTLVPPSCSSRKYGCGIGILSDL